MALDSTPWFVGGGAQHSPEVARLLAYASTSGAEGIVEPASLAVKAQSTPNGTVSVRPGAAIILNRYAGGSQQSYMLRNASSTSVPIPATTSTGGRTDAIVARVLDPQYEGAAPTDPVTFQYAQLVRVPSVSASLKNIEQLALPYPAVLLARVTLPASTATVTNSMITDLREVALPRREDVWRPRALATPDMETLTASPTGPGEYFPNNGGPQIIAIPKWATRAQIRCEWLGVRYAAGNAFGQMWVEYGPYLAASQRERSTQKYQFDTPAATNVSRANWIVVDDVYIPASYRGTEQMFVPKAQRLGGVTNSVSLDAVSGMNVQVRFLEAADPSTN